ncbi:MAG: DNA repair protein RecN [Clostridia bacterium]|nr:DNA repair protein RecN [Clostridia bacterium]
MIDSISVVNFAVVKDVSIRVCSGFNALTGETGAGKTVIAGCLGFLLGRRVSPDMIRSGESEASASVLFSDVKPDVERELAEAGIPVCDGEVLIERKLFADGKTAARINGKTVTLKLLSDTASSLLSLHGQRETVMYLDPVKRIGMLDEAAADAGNLDAYHEAYSRWSGLRSDIARTRSEAESLADKLDLVSFRYKEIASAKLTPGEDERLETERDAIRSAEKIKKYGEAALRALHENEKGITASYLTLRGADALEKIAGLVDGSEETVSRLRDIGYELEQIGGDLARVLSAVLPEDSEQRLDEIEERLSAVSRLKRKYGCGIDGLLKIASDSAEDLRKAKEASAQIARLESELATAEKKLAECAAGLTRARTEAAERVTESVLGSLRYLDLPGAYFEIRVSERPSYAPSGKDDVDFLFSANSGEPPLPVEKCASGGELSRLVLSLKSSLAGFAGGMTLFFDEIDSGISGSTSRKIGLMLKSAAAESQIICVTHSAQIASLADRHLRVFKSAAGGRTESRVEELNREGRILEISRILGGLSVSEAQRRAAVDMIDNNDKGNPLT